MNVIEIHRIGNTPFSFILLVLNLRLRSVLLRWMKLPDGF